MIDLSKLEKVRTSQDELIENERAAAIAYLKETDWYVLRQVETGAPVPDEIKEKRLEARKALSDA